MKIVWSNRAIERLEEIRDYIAREAPMTGNKVVAQIIEVTENLIPFPLLGRVVPEYKRKEIREIITPPYRILYHYRKDRIEIINVIHSRQLLK